MNCQLPFNSIRRSSELKGAVNIAFTGSATTPRCTTHYGNVRYGRLMIDRYRYRFRARSAIQTSGRRKNRHFDGKCARRGMACCHVAVVSPRAVAFASSRCLRKKTGPTARFSAIPDHESSADSVFIHGVATFCNKCLEVTPRGICSYIPSSL